MSTPRVLRALVRQTATCKRPLNSHDSLLILKALHSLRYRSDDVKDVCEKCAFSIASARITVPVERAIDALSSLLSLQAGPLPIVHDKLANRLMEVTPETTSPRLVQKAAVVVMKLGRRFVKPKTADHICDVLLRLVTLHPEDIPLRLAVISVYAYTSGATVGNETMRSEECAKDVERRRALLEAARHIVDARVLGTLRGNSALQALHMFPIISRQSVTSGSFYRAKEEEKENQGSAPRGDESTMATWDLVGKAFREELQLTTVVPGGYAQFLHDFLPSLDANDSCGLATKVALLSVIHHGDFSKALNSYDVAKIAMALSHTFQKRDAYRGKKKAAEGNVLRTTKDKQDGDGDSGWNGDDAGHELEQRTQLRVVESLVRQLYYFHTNAGWSRPDGGRVDQVAVAAVWGVTQKYVCGVQEKTEEVKNIVSQLVRLTGDIATKLSVVWSWVLFSMSMCARATAACADGLSDTIEALVEGSFLACRPSSLSLRSCVQALYAFSILMDLNVEKKDLLCSASTSVGAHGRHDGCGRRWGPDHPLVVDVLQRLQQFCFRAYSAEDVPMLLQALANIMKGAAQQQLLLPSAAHEMAQRVLHYTQGNRNAEWHCKHGVSMACAVLSMGQFMPDDRKLLNDVLKHIFHYLRSEGMMGLGAWRRLMEHVAILRREITPSSSFWASEHIAALLAEHVSRVCAENTTPIPVLLGTAELAHELGVMIVFMTPQEETIKPRGVTVLLDVPRFLHEGSMSPLDAAQTLRLMSCEVQRNGSVCATADHIGRLRHVAIHEKPVAAMRVETLLHLLRANANLQASRALFNEVSLHAILDVVSYHLTQRKKLLIQRGDAGKIVHAFLFSQVLLRLKRPLQSCDGLAAAVNDVLDAMEATTTEKPETLFQLRLLCGD